MEELYHREGSQNDRDYQLGKTHVNGLDSRLEELSGLPIFRVKHRWGVSHRLLSTWRRDRSLLVCSSLPVLRRETPELE